MFWFSKAMLLMMTLTLGTALRCYYCGGYSSSMSESNSNTRDCADGTFEGKEVQTREGSAGECVKRLFFVNGVRFVQRYLGYDSTRGARHSREALHIPTDNSSTAEGALAETTAELEEKSWLADERLLEEEEVQEESILGDLIASSAKRDRRALKISYASNDQYYYCSTNKCNAAPTALASALGTVLLLAVAAATLP